MRPLMTPEMHARFADLYDGLVAADENAAQVFVPVGPESGGPPPILFVGQATRGWSKPELADFDTAWRQAADVVGAPPSRSGFFQVVRRITAGVGNAICKPDAYTDLRTSIGWSNLVKVGHPDRNPLPPSWKQQADLCIEQLRHELEVLRPAAVVVMTRDFASKEILLPVFGDAGWKNDLPTEDRVAWKPGPTSVIWMNHPRHMGPTGYREGSIEKAIEVIGTHLPKGAAAQASS